jgi:hypothetical protein
LKARELFDGLVGLGGIPLRPWIDYRVEDLSDAERGDANGDKHIMRLYLEDSLYWQTQLKLWRRFAKRRGQGGEPDLRDLDPVGAVAASITYLRGHLQRDMEDRARPGCEIWPDYSPMVFHRSFIDDVLESLPAAEALRSQLESKRGHGAALREPPVTREELHEEYKLPRGRSWMDLWLHSQKSLGPSQNSPELGQSTPPRPSKRRRGEINDEDERGRSPKRVVSDSKPILESSELTRSTRVTGRRKQSPAKQITKKKTKWDKRKPSNSSAPEAIGNAPNQPSRATRARAPKRKTTAPAEGSQGRSARVTEQGSVIDAAGRRRSARIAAIHSWKR